MKEYILGKISQSLTESNYDAVVLFGYHNIQYATGAYLHFPPSFPDRYMALFWAKGEEQPVVILPSEWENSFLNLAYINKTKTYTEKPGSPSGVAEAVANLAKNTVRKTATIGVDASQVPYNVYRRLERALEDYQLESCDEWVKKLRMVKTQGEIDLLTEVAKKTDHAIAGQAHHVLVLQASTEMSNTENVRVHAIERLLDEVGHHAVAQVTGGSSTEKYWPGAPTYGIGYDKIPKPYEMMRFELFATVNGYWNKGARMLTMGEPTEEQTAAFNGLIELRKTALKHMKPGNTCSQVYQAMKQAASEKAIQIEPNMVLGAGVGVSDFESPYISEADETVLEPGMVILLRPVVKGPKGELMMSNDTVVVTEEGSKVVGWFKNWREPFIASYTL